MHHLCKTQQERTPHWLFVCVYGTSWGNWIIAEHTKLLTFILVQGIPQELSRRKGTLNKDCLAFFKRSLGEQSFTLKDEHRKSVKSSCCVSQACFLASQPSATSTKCSQLPYITHRLNLETIQTQNYHFNINIVVWHEIRVTFSYKMQRYI